MESGAAFFFGFGEDHGLHVGQAIFGKEHVLGAAEADAFGAEGLRLFRVARDVRVGEDAQLAALVDPAHELDEVRVVRIDGQGIQLAVDDAAGGAVEGEPVAFMEDFAFDAHLFFLFVDGDVAGAGYAALAHAAGDEGGVGGHAAAGSEDAGGNVHAGDVLG